MRVSQFLQILFLGLISIGCATPVQNVNKLASNYGFERRLVNSSNFQHVVYFSNFFKKQALTNQITNHDSSTLKDSQHIGFLHIYLEGDGSPWLQKHVVAEDPTPRNPLALTLMAQDSQPSVYIGRPCYFGFSRSQACNPMLWTHQRYSQIVVDSMVEVANKIIIEQESERVKLIGYSGGGVLAMLMADKIQQIDSVVTVAANLDIDAWAKLHHYSFLEGSINPATQPPLRPEIHQWHLVGEEDKNVPPGLVEMVIKRQVGTTNLIRYNGFDHICCWSEQWPKTLSALQ